MENNTSILSSLVQKGAVTKSPAGFGPSQLLTEEGAENFREVMHGAMQSAQENGSKQITSLVGLEQDIKELSAETEALLVNAKPEAVEGILAQAVAGLWELVGNFDAQNGTQFVSELSKNLAQVVVAPEDPQDTTDIAGLVSVIFIQPANIQSVELPGVQTVAPDIPTPAGGVEMQPLVVAQAQPQAGDASLFAKVTNLLPQLQPLAQNGQKSGPTIKANANVSVFASFEFIPKVISDGPQQIQQFAVETPLKNPALENTVAGQLVAELASTASKTGADTIQLSGSGAVKAKVKELLALSAQNIVSNTNAPVITGEVSSQLLQTRTELQNVNTATIQEHTRPPGSFSQNVASQIQGRPLNEGITRIELAPRGLGNVVIELKTKETGDIQIIVKAENSTVLHALRTDREMLLSVLSNEVSAQDGVDLEFEEFSDGQFNRDKDGVNFGEERAQSKLENEDDENSVNSASLVKRPLGAGQLNILT